MMSTVLVYLDVLFLYQLFLNSVVLSGVAVARGYRVKWYRFLAGSALGSLYACGLPLVHASFFGSLPLQIIVGLGIVWTVFHFSSAKEGLSLLAMYYLMNFILAGGIWFSLRFLSGLPGRLTLTAAAAGTLLFWALGRFYVYSVRMKRTESVFEFWIMYNGKSVRIKGFSDTGNTLTDPLEHWPVMVVKQEKLAELADFSHPERLKNFRPIPCRTVNSEHSLLYGFKPDGILWEGKSLRGVVAVSCSLAADGYDAIFNPVLLLP